MLASFLSSPSIQRWCPPHQALTRVDNRPVVTARPRFWAHVESTSLSKVIWAELLLCKVSANHLPHSLGAPSHCFPQVFVPLRRSGGKWLRGVTWISQGLLILRLWLLKDYLLPLKVSPWPQHQNIRQIVFSKEGLGNISNPMCSRRTLPPPYQEAVYLPSPWTWEEFCACLDQKGPLQRWCCIASKAG